MTTATKTRPKTPAKRPTAPAKAAKVEAPPADSWSARLPAQQLGNALRCVKIAASNDQCRPILCGTQVSRTDQGLRFVATDSYRLFVVDATLKADTLGAIPHGWSLLVDLDPSLFRWASDLCKGFGDITVTATPDGLAFGDTRRSVTLPKIEGSYPTWQGLMPERDGVNAVKEIGFNPDLLADIGAAAKALGAASSEPVRMDGVETAVKPTRFTASARHLDLKLTALLMPVRLS